LDLETGLAWMEQPQEGGGEKKLQNEKRTPWAEPNRGKRTDGHCALSVAVHLGKRGTKRRKEKKSTCRNRAKGSGLNTGMKGQVSGG